MTLLSDCRTGRDEIQANQLAQKLTKSAPTSESPPSVSSVRLDVSDTKAVLEVFQNPSTKVCTKYLHHHHHHHHHHQSPSRYLTVTYTNEN